MPRKRANAMETVSDGGAVRPFQVRLRERLHDALARDAARHMRSLNAEIVKRLEASYAEQEQTGGPEVQEIMVQVRAAFLHGGRLGAISRGHPEWGPEEWMRDDLARKVAMAAGADALVRVEKISAAADDPAAMERLMTTMIAWGMPGRLTEGDK
jgi:hypothetical protein